VLQKSPKWGADLHLLFMRCNLTTCTVNTTLLKLSFSCSAYPPMLFNPLRSNICTMQNRSTATVTFIFHVLLTVQPGTTLVKRPTWCTITLFIYYYNPLHVSSNCVLIIRASNCINTASGIVFSVSDRPVCRLRSFLLNLHTGRSLTENTTPDAVLIQFEALMMSTELLETCRGL